MAKRSLPVVRPRDAWEGDLEERFGVPWRPAKRGECARVERPCVHVACRHNLFLDVDLRSGAFGLTRKEFPQDVDQHRSCSLDLAERGGMSLEEVADALNVTKQRAQQIEASAVEKLRAALPDATFESQSPEDGTTFAEGDSSSEPEEVDAAVEAELDAAKEMRDLAYRAYKRALRARGLIPIEPKGTERLSRISEALKERGTWGPAEQAEVEEWSARVSLVEGPRGSEAE